MTPCRHITSRLQTNGVPTAGAWDMGCSMSRSFSHMSSAEFHHRSWSLSWECCRHQLFVDMVREQPAADSGSRGEYPMQRLPSDNNRPRDIPVYTQDLTSAW